MREINRRPAGILLPFIGATLMLPALACAQLARSQPDAVTGADPDLAQVYGYWRAGQWAQVLALMGPPANQGNAVAQFLMGELYDRGDGVPQDDEQAVRWWRKAAEQGLARAQNEVGVALTDGRGMSPDPQQAVLWYRKAADQGLDVAQVNLGLMYLNGLGGLTKDDQQAVSWFRKAADQGLGWAQYYLGVAYLEGRGVRRNTPAAADWIRKAAEQEYMEAEYSLGVMYVRGTGVDQDYARATIWFVRAARDGYDLNERFLTDELLPHLSRVRPPASTEIREGPATTAAIIRTTDGREYAYVLEHSKKWTEVLFESGHTVGYISTEQLHGK